MSELESGYVCPKCRTGAKVQTPPALKSAQDYKISAGKDVINALATIFENAELNFSKNHNRQLGMGEFLAILVTMIKESCTAEAACRHLSITSTEKIASAKWFLNLMHSINPENADKLCNTLLTEIVDSAKLKELKNGRIYVAVDKHNIPRHDEKKTKKLVGSQYKSGTSTFEVYATMQAVAGSINSTLDCFRFVKESNNVDFIRKFTHQLDEKDIRPYA